MSYTPPLTSTSPSGRIALPPIALPSVGSSQPIALQAVPSRLKLSSGAGGSESQDDVVQGMFDREEPARYEQTSGPVPTAHDFEAPAGLPKPLTLRSATASPSGSAVLRSHQAESFAKAVVFHERKGESEGDPSPSFSSAEKSAVWGRLEFVSEHLADSLDEIPEEPAALTSSDFENKGEVEGLSVPSGATRPAKTLAELTTSVNLRQAPAGELSLPNFPSAKLTQALADGFKPACCCPDSPTDLDRYFFDNKGIDTQWDAIANHLVVDTPEWVFAKAMDLLATTVRYPVAAQHDGKGYPFDNLGLAADATAPENTDLLPVSRFDSGHGVAVIGTTYPNMPAKALQVQDGVALSDHATVVLDGVNGHRNDAEWVRNTREFAGAAVTAVIETIARTQTNPVAYLEKNHGALLHLLNSAMQARTHLEATDVLFSAAAHFPHGTVLFGIGDCIIKACTNEQGKALWTSFIPKSHQDQPVGLGAPAGFAPKDISCITLQGVTRVIAGTDGLFNLVDIAPAAGAAGQAPAAPPQKDGKGAGFQTVKSLTQVDGGRLAQGSDGEASDLLLSTLGNHVAGRRPLTDTERWSAFNSAHPACARALNTFAFEEVPVTPAASGVAESSSASSQPVASSATRQQLLTMGPPVREGAVLLLQTLLANRADSENRGKAADWEAMKIRHDKLQILLREMRLEPLPDFSAMQAAARVIPESIERSRLDDFAFVVRSFK